MAAPTPATRLNYSDLRFNGTTPTEVRFNGTSLTRLKWNGVDKIHCECQTTACLQNTYSFNIPMQAWVTFDPCDGWQGIFKFAGYGNTSYAQYCDCGVSPSTLYCNLSNASFTASDSLSPVFTFGICNRQWGTCVGGTFNIVCSAYGWVNFTVNRCGSTYGNAEVRCVCLGGRCFRQMVNINVIPTYNFCESCAFCNILQMPAMTVCSSLSGCVNCAGTMVCVDKFLVRSEILGQNQITIATTYCDVYPHCFFLRGATRLGTPICRSVYVGCRVY